MKQLTTYLPLLLLLLLGACKNAKTGSAAQLTDDALMDTVQRRTFNYFWEGAEPNSGLAPERIHIDGIYPEKTKTSLLPAVAALALWRYFQVSTATTSLVKKVWHVWKDSLFP